MKVRIKQPVKPIAIHLIPRSENQDKGGILNLIRIILPLIPFAERVTSLTPSIEYYDSLILA